MTIDPLPAAPPPLVSGEDLKALGLREGPRLERTLRELYDMQLAEELCARQKAMAAVREMITHSQ